MSKELFFVTPNLANGGAERVTAVLAQELARTGDTVTVVYMKDDKTVYPVGENVQVQMLFSSGSRVKRIAGKILRLRQLMRQNPTATFVAMLPFETLYTFLASRGLPCRVVYSLRNDPGNMNTRRDRFILRHIYPRADAIVFQTEDAKAFFSERIQEKGSVIPNPLSESLPERYTGVRKKEIVTVGRLTEQKNIPMLLRAFAAVHKKHSDWSLNIYGQGKLQEKLENLCEKLRISGCVKFSGFTENVVQKINASGIFAMASDYEGISNAMLEALATGVPCVCTDCPIGGARMMIRDHENGILVPVGDTQAMTQALLELIENPALAEELSKNSVSIRNELSVAGIAEKWKGIL